ncbi:MAG TPA: prepilin-type cleavage/methylation domain-containing protein [Methylotenera sp.]
MAVVLIILGFVLGALLMPVQVQRQQQAQLQTESLMEISKKSLIGYAQSQGRLPCPATNNGTAAFPDDHGVASPSAGGLCVQQVGFLPAATLGIQPTDTKGFALDGWGNPIRYAVTQSSAGGAATADFTTTADMAAVGIAALQPDIRVCASSTAASCTDDINVANNVVAVIYSLGPTGNVASGGADENENLDIDAIFISHEPRANGDNGEFDHIMTWISPFVLYNAMIEAGQLH